MWRMSRALSAGDFDVLLFPTIYSYVPVLTRARKIIVIHDVIADTYPQLTLPSPTARILWKTKVAAGLRQADAIVTVSDFSRDGIVQRFGIQPERIAVVGEASDPVFRRLPDASLTTRLRDLGVPEAGRLVVYVGGFSPHKNLEPLVDAVAALASRPGFEDIRLVMVGEHKREVFHSYFDVVARRVAAAGVANRTIFTGYLSDEDVVVLLNRSAVLALPSLIEGFGLPAVEAAACGCPVVATTASPLPGLLGDGAICVDPREPGALAAALERVLASEPLQASMRKAGLDAASRLTWEAAARQMLGIVGSVAAR
jgi:glycosyltransferase involved in cell wall biosynthesis